MTVYHADALSILSNDNIAFAKWKYQFGYNNKWKSTKLAMVKRSSIKCIILLRTEFSNTAELLLLKSE